MSVSFFHFFQALMLILDRPHSRKEAKFDSKTKLYQLNEMAGKLSINVLSSAEKSEKKRKFQY